MPVTPGSSTHTHGGAGWKMVVVARNRSAKNGSEPETESEQMCRPRTDVQTCRRVRVGDARYHIPRTDFLKLAFAPQQNQVAVPKKVALEPSRRDLSKNVSLDLCVVYSSCEN